MTRVAVVLPGHVRTFSKCWPKWLHNVVEPNGWDCRYFVRTYDVAEMTERTSRPLGPSLALAESRRLVDEAMDILRPLSESIVVEPESTAWAETDSLARALAETPVYVGRAGNARAQTLQCRQLRLAYEPLRALVEADPERFDLVVRTRFDLEFDKPVSLDPAAQLPDDRCIVWISRGSMPDDSMCDCFAAMRPSLPVLDRYFRVGDTLVGRARGGMRAYNLETHFGCNMAEAGFVRVALPNPGNAAKVVR